MIFQLLIVFMCFSCGNPNQEKGGQVEQEDSFYTAAKEGDLYRVPLVKPIQIISTNGIGSDWILKFPYRQIKNKKSVEVSAVNVVDSLIIVYSESTYLPGAMTEAWFLIDTKNKTEVVYQNENDYVKGLAEIKIKEPRLIEINQLYGEFKETQKLPFK